MNHMKLIPIYLSLCLCCCQHLFTLHKGVNTSPWKQRIKIYSSYMLPAPWTRPLEYCLFMDGWD